MKAILWTDVETSGVDPFEDSLLEIAVMATDISGNPLSDLKEFVIPNRDFSVSDSLVIKMHDRSGLWEDLWNAPPISMEKVDKKLSNWVEGLQLNPKKTFFGGNSITLDREFVGYNLPRFYSHFSHRSIDVTSIALTLQGNFNFAPFEKKMAHRAGADVLESIEEYKFYLEKISSEI